jgi:hypothetical protein
MFVLPEKQQKMLKKKSLFQRFVQIKYMLTETFDKVIYIRSLKKTSQSFFEQ